MSKNKNNGRPSKTFSEKRKFQVNVKFNIEEQVFLNKQIRDSGLTCNEFIRQCIKKSEIKQRLTVEQIALLKQLIGMANNINQVAKRINTHGYDSAENEYLFLANDINKLIKQLLK